MEKEKYKQEINKLINAEPNKIRKYTVTINNDKPIFNQKDYATIEGKPNYYKLDREGRSNGAIAIISPNTLPLITKKKLKYPSPSNWSKSFENEKIFEKSHIIAYSLSAKIANPNNIFIGTIKLNRSYMKKVENEVKRYVKNNLVRILYKVTVKYKGANKIPTGVLIEAQSIDDDYSICRFCYNVQKGKNFRYDNGFIDTKKHTLGDIIQDIKDKFSRKSNRKQQYLNFVINIKTKVFHLYDDGCIQSKNIEPENEQETTAKEKDLLKKNLKPCKKCFTN